MVKSAVAKRSRRDCAKLHGLTLLYLKRSRTGHIIGDKIKPLNLNLPFSSLDYSKIALCYEQVVLSMSDVEEKDIVIESEMMEWTQRSETVMIEPGLTVHARSGGLFGTEARRQIL